MLNTYAQEEGAGGLGEGWEVVAAFEDGDEFAGAVLVGEVLQVLPEPVVVFGEEAEATEGVGLVGVKAGRY